MITAGQQMVQQANTNNNKNVWGSIIYNVKAYGADGDGESDDSTNIARAIADADDEGGIVMFPPGTYITGNQTVPSNVTLWFANGAMLSVNSGTTVTINGSIEAGLYQIFSGSGSISGSIKNEVVYPQWWGATLNGVSDDTIPLQKSLTAHYNVFITVGNLRITSTVNLKAFQKICGEGEGSNIYADFVGGSAALKYGGGNPIVIRDLKISRNSSLTPVEGDSGLEIGFTTAWAGRGELSNLFISSHYDGFKWKGGSVNTMRNIQCVSNKRHGFFGVNPRGELTDSISSENAGNGYYFYADTIGETGIQLINCGTFANQFYGMVLDANNGVSAANVFINGFSSSFDGQGGILCEKPYTQLNWNRVLIEYAGYATNFKPDFTTFSNSKGLVLSTDVTKSSFSSIQIMHCKGTGLILDGTDDVLFTNLFVHDNGTGGGTGVDRVGIQVQNSCTRTMINGFSTGLSSSNQTTDLSVPDANNTGLLSNGMINSEFLGASQTGISVSNVLNTAVSDTASVASVQLPLTHDFINITGTTTITSIYASWKGRRVTLKFAGALTVTDGGNLKLNGNFVTTADDTLTLVCDGTNWYEVSRSAN